MEVILRQWKAPHQDEILEPNRNRFLLDTESRDPIFGRQKGEEVGIVIRLIKMTITA
jgi:hypothetical protein